MSKLTRNISGSLVLLALVTGVSPSFAKAYSNASFGFSVVIPDRLKTCWDGYRPYEHGIIFALDDYRGCELDNKHPSIDVSGDFNAGFSPSADDFVKDLCTPHSIANSKDGKLGAVPPGLQIGTRRSAACRVDNDDGWIDVEVLTVDGQWGSGFGTDAAAPKYIHGASLKTTAKRFDQDLALFRSILKTVRLFKPHESKGN